MTDEAERAATPIIADKDYSAPSIFQPENMLREARRQKALAAATVPDICILDPDGDIVRMLIQKGHARRSDGWACYHTDLYEFDRGDNHFGIVGCVVGAPFAVLVAEELFASGCRFLVSVTSAGQIVPRGQPPYFVVIDRALRDEGTSYHYLPSSEFAVAESSLIMNTMNALAHIASVFQGASWTTDAPFRETALVIERRQQQGILAVEMEAAGLYAFAEARNKAVLCLAHVTNQLAVVDGDFEKGEESGTRASLNVISVVAEAWRASNP